MRKVISPTSHIGRLLGIWIISTFMLPVTVSLLFILLGLISDAWTPLVSFYGFGILPTTPFFLINLLVFVVATVSMVFWKNRATVVRYKNRFQWSHGMLLGMIVFGLVHTLIAGHETDGLGWAITILLFIGTAFPYFFIVILDLVVSALWNRRERRATRSDDSREFRSDRR
jgi:hypothetical protein